MRVKIIRWTDPTSSNVTLRVQRWCAGQWELVDGGEFGLHQSDQANEFAMKLSMSKREPVEMAMFEDGEKLAKPENIIDRLLRENAAANAALPDYEPEGQ